MTMMVPYRQTRQRPIPVAGGCLLALLTMISQGGAADPPPEALQALPTPVAHAAPVSAPLVLDLNTAIQLALERQPSIAMRRASLAAAQDGQRAINSLHVPDAIAHQLPIRRRQSALGVTAAASGVDHAENEVIYAVTRTYFTVLYAREQEAIARSVANHLGDVQKTARKMLDEGTAPRDLTASDVDRALVFTRLAQAKQVQAAVGIKRALAALKEAVGLGPEVCIDVPAASLPTPTVRPCEGDIIALALARRGVLVRANVFAEVVGLEAQAQGTSCHRRMETFASGADIHSETVPQEIHDTEYQPGATPPAMPDAVAGSRCDRVQIVEDYHARAVAGVEQVRILIGLEAENAYLRWEEASQEVDLAREAADTADKIAADQDRDYRGLKGKVGPLVDAWALAGQTRGRYNEYLYNLILALADLQRVTAGGFCAGLVGAPAPARAAGGK